jgi:hypothetical protein
MRHLAYLASGQQAGRDGSEVSPMSQRSETRRRFLPLNFGASDLRRGEFPAIVVTAAVYGVVAYLSMAFTLNDGVATIWPSNGIVLTALLLIRRPAAPRSSHFRWSQMLSQLP